MSLANILNLSGMESLEPEVKEEINEVVDEVVEAQVEAALAKTEATVAESDKELEVTQVALEVIEDKVEDLQELVCELEEQIDGTESFNAGVFTNTLKRASKVAASFGVKVEVAGTENYADHSTAVLNAHAGIESLKDTAKAAAAKAKEVLIALFNAFMSFVKGIFDQFIQIENRAKGLEKKVSALTALKAGKVKLPAGAGWVDDKGTAPSVASSLKIVAGAAADAVSLDAVQAAVNALKGLGDAKISGSKEGLDAFKVTVNGGSFSVSYPKDSAHLSGVSVSDPLGGQAREIDGLTNKSALSAILTRVMSDAKAVKSSKLDESGLKSHRDKIVAQLENYGATGKGAQPIVKDAARAGIAVSKGGLKVAAAILKAQLAFVSAHV